ncbi:MAG: OmpW family outer membrane protein [Pseudomonadota bacterium]
MRKTICALGACAMTLMGFGPSAVAEKGDWFVRGRLIYTVPDESETFMAGGAEFAGDVRIDNQVMPELDISYFLTDNIALELILAVTPHDVDATNVTIGDALIDADLPLGDTLLLPPTLNLQYHFDTGTRYKPYVGAGINVTFFLNEDEGPVADDIDYDTGVGFSLQAGLDIDIDGEPGGWAVNADIKKLWLETDVTVDASTALGPVLNTDSVIIDADVNIDPWIFGVGLGYRF